MLRCKICFNTKRREYFKNNPEALKRKKLKDSYKSLSPERKKRKLKASAKYREKNKEELLKRSKLYRKNNKEKIRASQKKYNKKNPHVAKKRKMARKEKESKALVEWRDVEAIRDIYKVARSLEEETGVRYHVDHILPLNHENICGLHVRANLQILTASENCSKQNYFDWTINNESWREKFEEKNAE